MKVKYTNSKWFLENNGEWIEITPKWWEEIRKLVYKHLGEYLQQPTPDTEYQLPDDVGFEIGYDCPSGAIVQKECRKVYRRGLDGGVCSCKKVAHLKVEKKEQPVKQLLDIIAFAKWYSGMETDKVIRAFQRWQKEKSSNIPNPYPDELLEEWKKDTEYDEKQEQSEVERLREENKQLKEEVKSLEYWNKEKQLGHNANAVSFAVAHREEELDIVIDDLKEKLQDEIILKEAAISGCTQRDKLIKELESKLSQLQSLAHKGLPQDCILGYDEVKFCTIRNGERNKCQHCSNYNSSQLPKEEEQGELWDEVGHIIANNFISETELEQLKSQFTIIKKG